MILVRFPIWLTRIPWRWIICSAFLLGFAIWYFISWQQALTALWANVETAEDIARFK